VDTAAISLVTTCARLCPEVLKDYVAKILNILLSHTEHRPDLMKTVDLGPFKHSVDEGIALRKAAFEALLALLPSFLSSFQDENVSESLVDALTKGLKDHQDVRGVVEKLFNYLLTNEDAFQLLLASKDGDSKLSKIVAVLSDMVSSKPKENAVAQEMEKHKVSKCFYWMK
jgi:cullin-associated NEDD8-dissociated protein 1